MSKKFFELSEFRDRQRRVRLAMESRGIDTLLVTSPINIHYLIGSAAKSYQTFQCLIFPLDPTKQVSIFLRLSDTAEVIDESIADDVRGCGGRKLEDPIEAFVAYLREKGDLRAKIGLEAPAYYLSVSNYKKLMAALSDCDVTDATTLIEELKYVKSDAELAYIRRAAQIADIGMEAIVANISPGRTEREVAAEAHRAMFMAGGDSPASPMNFVSGERTCYAHGAFTDRVLDKGDFIHVEYGGAYRRYTSTMARHISIGKPSPLAQKVHDATLRACDACIAAIKDGVNAEVPHLAAVDAIDKAGLLEFNLHLAGYGVGPGFPPAWGESLRMFFGSKDTLKKGMVVSIEPPIFIHKDRIGARLIDCVVVESDRARILSGYPRELVIV